MVIPSYVARPVNRWSLDMHTLCQNGKTKPVSKSLILHAGFHFNWIMRSYSNVNGVHRAIS